jgi:hypothetical protein
MAENVLRIVADNIVDRAGTTVTATSVAIAAANLITNSKNEVWRSVAAVTTASVTTSWTNLENVNMVSMFGNFSPTATMVVKCYSDTAGATLIYTHTSTFCSPATAIKVAGLTAAQSVSAYAYGGGSVARVFFPVKSARRVTIDIIDTNNLQGYLEAWKLVVGEYFQPTYGAEIGASFSMEDMSKNYRSDSGTLHTDVGARYKKLTMNMNALKPVDQKAMWKIVSYCGISSPVWVSGYPDNTDRDLEQANTVWGKFSQVSVLSANVAGVYAMPLEVEAL